MPAQEGRSPHPQSGPCGHTRGLLEERDAHCGGQHRHSMPKPGGCLTESLCPSAQEHETSSGGLDRTRPTTDECADMGPHAGETCLSLLHCSARIRVWKPKRVSVWLLNLQQIFFYFSGNLPTSVSNGACLCLGVGFVVVLLFLERDVLKISTSESRKSLILIT